MSSDTQRTDAKAVGHIGFYSCATVPADFARQLERELATALDAQRTPCCEWLREEAIEIIEGRGMVKGEFGNNHYRFSRTERQIILEALAHPCSCQRTGGKEGDAPCEKSNVTAQSGSEETSGDTAVIVHSDSGEPDSSSLPVAEIAEWTVLDRKEGVLLSDVIGGGKPVVELISRFKARIIVDAHNAAIRRQYAPEGGKV